MCISRIKMGVNFIIELIRIILTITRPLTYVVFDIIGRIILGKQDTLPPIRSKYLLMSATELADHIRKRKVTAEHVMETYINRVKEVNPLINACIDERFEEALTDARAVDKMIEERNMTEDQMANDFPLLGVPFSCKESVGVTGLAQTNGLLFYKDRKAPSDGAIVREYKKAGAIPYMVTNVPTLCMMWETYNLVFGRTMNPYDKRRTPGGSTGGEGAIITSAGSVIGIGTDIGGSIRIPSAFCGIYGHKPSRGIISNERPWPDINHKYDTFKSTGPMCRYVKDLKSLVKISSAEDASTLDLEKEVDFSKVKIFYIEELPGIALSATQSTKEAVRKAADHFYEKFGTHPTKLAFNEMKYALEIVQAKFIEADGAPIRNIQKTIKINWYWEFIKSLFGRARFDFSIICIALMETGNKDKNYYKFLEMYESLKNKLEEALSGDSILIMPTHPEPAPHLYTPVIKFKNVGYTCLFNCLGYPATNVPAGMSYGMPIGLQIVSTQNKDCLTISAAEELDTVFFGWKSPCEIDV